jgi:hypothetical protein
MTSRTQDEIKARYEAENDMFGFAREVLAESMNLTSLAAHGYDITQLDGWEPVAGDKLETNAREYLDFAIEKIEGHRGISASRSVDKLTAYAWLLGRDDVVQAMAEAGYAQYGAPKIKAFATTLGWRWPDDVDLNRMADGDSCRVGCEDGCGR